MSTLSAKLGLNILHADPPGDPPADSVAKVLQNWSRLDAMVQARVIDRNLATPPGSPANGDAYLVAAGGTGAWSGQDGSFTWYDGSAWQFHTPTEGWRLWVADEFNLIIYDGSAWTSIGEGAAGGAAQGTYVEKSADESVTNDATPQDDDALVFAANAGTRWSFMACLYYTPASASGIKVSMDFSGSGEVMDWGVSSEAESPAHDATSDTEVIAGAGARKLIMTGTADLTASPGDGTVAIQWAQGASEGSACTVYKGSWIRSFKIP